MVDYAKTKHAIDVAIEAPDTLDGAVRRFDAKSRTLRLSEILPRASRRFHLAYQIGLIEARDAVDAIVAAAKLASPETETLVRVGLHNYFAGAVLMPYAPYLEAARSLRYDIERLAQRFGVGIEQACHRLATLQRPSDKAVPFWLMRVDAAGNVSKRISAGGFHFSRFGGSCPRLIVHEAFASPGRTLTQIARLPDGATFFASRARSPSRRRVSASRRRYSPSRSAAISRAPANSSMPTATTSPTGREKWKSAWAAACANAKTAASAPIRRCNTVWISTRP